MGVLEFTAILEEDHQVKCLELSFTTGITPE